MGRGRRRPGMTLTYIEDAGKHVGQDVTIRGWLRHRRSSGKLQFLVVRDGTGDVQAVVSKAAVGDEQFEKTSTLTQESSLALVGTVREDKRAPGGYEFDREHTLIHHIP